jgi:hypothetical protein
MGKSSPAELWPNNLELSTHISGKLAQTGGLEPVLGARKKNFEAACANPESA